MKYLCLVYFDESYFSSLPTQESDALWAQGEALVLELRERPDFVAADGLEPTTTAATLRVRDGNVFVKDGPFAETKEQLGGFLLIDAPDLDEAIKVAARVPTAGFGSVEVRPIRDLERSHRASGRRPS